MRKLYLLSVVAAIGVSTAVTASPSTVEQGSVDVTHLISDPSFENNGTGWSINGMEAQSNGYFNVKDGDIFMQRWVGIGSKVEDVSVSQNLSNLANGHYLLSAVALNVKQRIFNSTVNVGSPQTGAELFAGDYSVTVNDCNEYELTFLVIDGNAEIGFRTRNATGNWVAVDNFKLTYLGPNSSDDYVMYLTKCIEDIKKGLLSEHVQDAVRISVEKTIAEVEALFTGVVDEDVVKEAKKKLDEAVAPLQPSAELYASLYNEIENALRVVEWYKDDTDKVAPLVEAVHTAESAWNNFLLSDTELENAKETIKAAYRNVDKKIHTSRWYLGNVNNPDNNYYIGRTRQSKNWILFWEKGYGENPKNFTCGSYIIDIDEVLRRADIAFEYYTDVLKFIKRGGSKADNYKMIIRLRYEPTEWEATGSGVDNQIGLLTLTPSATSSRNWQTLYHEVGHCFQYQVHCDNGDQNGWMYSPGDGLGCAFWEQCAQWQAYKIMPNEQFTNEWFNGYLANCHKHILHETPRYNNYFVQDYWTYKHGIEFIGRLWNESKNPEDAVEAYMRITNISTAQFYDEMYDCAARFASWDIPALSKYGASKITARPLPAMTAGSDDFWKIDASAVPENTGHNIIRLNLPTDENYVTAIFEGLNNEPGFNNRNIESAEWRFGFVAMLNDDTRVYGPMNKATYSNPRQVVRFTVPDDTKYIWFVVSGGSDTYWRQFWDENDANDEQWPYKVKFGNTNRYGSRNIADTSGVIMMPEDMETPSVTAGFGAIHIGECGNAVTVRVINVSGVITHRIEAGLAPVDVEIQPGIYMVQIIAEDGRSLNTMKVAVK